MADILLQTKLHRPSAHADVLLRPRVTALLDKAADANLTLVAAPAGFGKSTLAAEWLSIQPQRAAWLSLDERDNDPPHFWRYVIVALARTDTAIGAEAIEILRAAGSVKPAMTALLNDLSAQTDDLFLVLDDYHAIDDDAIHESLQFMLDNQPPALHLILLTRVNPPLRLARLRARRQMIEIRADSLGFTRDETARLLNDRMGLALEPAQITALSQRTEGWITVLQLVGLSLQSQSDRAAFIERFTGSHRFILDYLTEEVLQTLPDELRGFLMQTAILGRMCASLCQAVTGHEASPRCNRRI